MKNIVEKYNAVPDKTAGLFRPILFILPFIFLLASCEDFFESTVEIDIPEHESRLTLTSRFSLEDTLLSVHLSKSLGILSNESYPVVTDGKVELYENGSLLTTFDYVSQNGFYQALLPQGTLKSGATYRLEAAAGGQQIYAEQKMPQKPELLSASFEKEGTIDEFGDRADEIKIELKDRSGESNYYMVRAYEVLNYNGQTLLNDLSLYSFDPLLIYGWDDNGNYREPLLFSDAAFEGRQYEMQLHTYTYDDGANSEGILIRLFEITRERYLFLNTFYQYYYNEDNPFAEPVNVFDNIEDGYGIFSVEAFSEYFIPF